MNPTIIDIPLEPEEIYRSGPFFGTMKKTLDKADGGNYSRRCQAHIATVEAVVSSLVCSYCKITL